MTSETLSPLLACNGFVLVAPAFVGVIAASSVPSNVRSRRSAPAHSA